MWKDGSSDSVYPRGKGSQDTGGENLPKGDSWRITYGRLQSNLEHYRFENCRGVVRSKIIAAVSLSLAFFIFVLPVV